MPIRTCTGIRALLLLLGGAVFALACNLTTTPPTPTARPAQPTATGSSAAPTLFASITPLPGLGGGVSPTQPPSNTTCPSTPPNWIPYTVEAGDSIGALATATSTTIQDIVNANCLTDPDTLFTGQVIYLPRSPVSG
ncbi:MAG: LysM peptidoglycan-binding domain-containing protein [Anaerolineae bacterium]|nr:LysM peptidoglycan-binding domain-containing protein [Anaerolineae bacterium]